MTESLATLVDVESIRKWLGEYEKALALVQTPFEAKRALTRIEIATEYVRQLKLGITVEMDVIEKAVFTEFILGQTLKAAKDAGELREGRPTKTVLNKHSFKLNDAGISRHESERSQRYVEYVEKFELDSLRDLVRERKLNQTLSRSSVYKTIDQALRRNQHETKSANPIERILGPFDIILADPPWRYEQGSTESRAIENQYPTASLDEIKKHVPNATDVSVLFLWATAPKLREAIQVMDAWQFEYRTNAIWDKQIIGMGYWFRGQHELLLVGTRGGFAPPSEFLRVSSIFSEKRSTHSTKPNCVYEWIEKAWPQLPKLEMYSRTKRPGWATWGTEN